MSRRQYPFNSFKDKFCNQSKYGSGNGALKNQ